MHLFRRNVARDGAPVDGAGESILVSHILVKFLKRLRHLERPHLLDLGRLCGANIEFFAGRGLKVHVEDLLPDVKGLGSIAPPAAGPAEAALDAADAPTAGIVPVSDGPAPSSLPARATVSLAAPRVVQGPGGQRSSTATQPLGVITRPGARPTRRIVLPPRTFASQTQRPGSADAVTASPSPLPRVSLPTTFSYPDESFDALVAWDLFNFYEPAAMTLLASETRRILKPGGLLFAYFHARRPEGLESPLRFRILDEGRVACDSRQGPLLKRHVYQNRDIEKMFAGLSIVELYFLKNAKREIMMEKKAPRPIADKPPARAASPGSKFTLE